MFPVSVCPGPPRHPIHHHYGLSERWEVVDALTGDVIWTANERGVLCHGALKPALPVPDPLPEEDLHRRRGRFKYSQTYRNPESPAKRGPKPAEMAAAQRGALTVHHLIGRLERLLITSGFSG